MLHTKDHRHHHHHHFLCGRNLLLTCFVRCYLKDLHHCHICKQYWCI